SWGWRRRWPCGRSRAGRPPGRRRPPPRPLPSTAGGGRTGWTGRWSHWSWECSFVRVRTVGTVAPWRRSVMDVVGWRGRGRRDGATGRGRGDGEAGDDAQLVVGRVGDVQVAGAG